MKKFRIFIVVWGVVLVVIFCLFTILSINVSKKLKEYHNLENYFADKVAEYNNTNGIYPETIEVLTINLNEAIEKGIVSELRISDDTCDGYVSISNDSGVVYIPYIKCKNYVTDGYSEEMYGT